MVAQDADEQVDVGEVRDVFQRQPVFRQQAGDQQRQRGVLGAGNRNRAVERSTAVDPDPIHKFELLRIETGQRRGLMIRACTRDALISGSTMTPASGFCRAGASHHAHRALAQGRYGRRHCSGSPQRLCAASDWLAKRLQADPHETAWNEALKKVASEACWSCGYT